MATKKTAPTITTRQIYEKVCSVEKMLKDCLEAPSPAMSPSEKQPYLAAAAPDLPLSVIHLENATDFLPCFDEADLFYGMKDIPVIMSYCPEQVMRIGEEYYLTGPMIFFRLNEEGGIVSLTVEDLYQLAEFLEEHTVILMTGPDSFVGIRLD